MLVHILLSITGISACILRLCYVCSVQHYDHRELATVLAVCMYEPSHEIMVLFVLRKLIFQTRMRSHPVGLQCRCLIVGRIFGLFAYLLCANSEGSSETVQMRRLA